MPTSNPFQSKNHEIRALLGGEPNKRKLSSLSPEIIVHRQFLVFLFLIVCFMVVLFNGIYGDVKQKHVAAVVPEPLHSDRPAAGVIASNVEHWDNDDLMNASFSSGTDDSQEFDDYVGDYSQDDDYGETELDGFDDSSMEGKNTSEDLNEPSNNDLAESAQGTPLEEAQDFSDGSLIVNVSVVVPQAPAANASVEVHQVTSESDSEVGDAIAIPGTLQVPSPDNPSDGSEDIKTAPETLQVSSTDSDRSEDIETAPETSLQVSSTENPSDSSGNIKPPATADPTPQPDTNEQATNDPKSKLDDEAISYLPVVPVPAEEPGFKKNPRIWSDTYVPRGKPLSDADRNQLASEWGQWSFVDPKASQRPKEDYFAAYPNRDIPIDKFPDNAWQIDKDYLSKFLKEGKDLVDRALEAILSEYGRGRQDQPNATFETRSDMFQLSIADSLIANEAAGTIDQASFDGLVKRLLHAIVTEDTFVFVMGGHSAAAGHGNHYQQSYTLEFQKVMEPIFARFGVRHVSRNIAMGGLGTSQNAMAAGCIYGDDIDILLWDSGMTEREQPVIDMFMRQGLISGRKVPFLWGGSSGILEHLRQHANADVGMYGNGLRGVPKTQSMNHALSLPWAVQYLDCVPEIKDQCAGHKYHSMCWIARSDVTPSRAQKAFPSGRASWHPGTRSHLLQSRVLAFTVLSALKEGLSIWASSENYLLPDSAWHITHHYNGMRTSMESLPRRPGDCYDISLPDRICSVPIQGRTEFTPRANPAETSIRTIVQGIEYLPKPLKNIYDPPDVPIPTLDAADGSIDYLSIVENGVAFQPMRGRVTKAVEPKPQVAFSSSSFNRDIVPGKGWGLSTVSAPDNCDGSYDSFCGRSTTSECLLSGHNDNRGGLTFDSLSGWLIMELTDFRHGIIMLKIEDWHVSGENAATNGWQCENNDCGSATRRDRNLRIRNETTADTRALKFTVPEYCDNFSFEFAVDGQVTSWNKTEWLERMVNLQRVVQLRTLLDDPSFTGGQSTPLELAIRARGCDRIKTFFLTHVYWA